MVCSLDGGLGLVDAVAIAVGGIGGMAVGVLFAAINLILKLVMLR